MEILFACCAVILTCLLIIFYFLIIKPYQDEKAQMRKRKLPKWEEIDRFILENDPFKP